MEDTTSRPDLPAYARGSPHEGQPDVISETGNWWIAELSPEGPWAPYAAAPGPTVDAFLALSRDSFLALMAEPGELGATSSSGTSGGLNLDCGRRLPAARPLHTPGAAEAAPFFAVSQLTHLHALP